MNPIQGETIFGAIIASLICFFSSLVTLLSQDGVNSLTQISEAAWISLVAGTLIAFLKDYQALAVRRWSAAHILRTETVFPKQNYPKAYPNEVNDQNPQ